MPRSRRLSPHSILLVLILVLTCGLSAPQPIMAAALQTARIRYLSPAPGARLVLPETNILIRLDRTLEPGSVIDPSAIVVTGAESGVHPGLTHVADDASTLLFLPDRPFAWGEKVTVRFDQPMFMGSATAPERVSFSFEIAATKPVRRPDFAMLELRSEMGLSSTDDAGSRSAPAADRVEQVPPGYPLITANVYHSTAAGSIFLAPFSFAPPNDPYLLILDNSCFPVFYRRMPNSCYDLKVQPNGLVTYYDSSVGKFIALDATMSPVDSFACGNGYGTDLHELALLANGHALLLSYDPEPVDMSLVVSGGNPNAIVTGLIVQELDQDKNVVFQWRSWDHFQITDATHEDLTAPFIDYVHGNAIEVDTDNNLLISSRHMDEITKIDRVTGEILWRWGGKHNQFTFVGDTLQFSHQHAIRRLPNGNFSLYDNGNWHDPSFSRAVQYLLDENEMTAQATWEYRNSPDEYGFAMGYVQRLDNGDRLIGWGAAKPDIIEVAPDGAKLMDVTLPTGVYTYRAYRFDWTAPTASVSDAGLSSGVSLSAGSPNPLRDRTQMTLDLSERAKVSLRVYDISGREVLNALDHVPFEAGRHSIRVDLSNRTPGLYFCRLTANGFSVTRKLLLIH